MGTWISHLRIAESLLHHFPGLDEVTFTFGNLSPDSGIPNADWTAFDPPKEIAHFLQKEREKMLFTIWCFMSSISQTLNQKLITSFTVFDSATSFI